MQQNHLAKSFSLHTGMQGFVTYYEALIFLLCVHIICFL